MKIKIVSLAGQDDNTPIDKLKELAVKYPQLELGVLLSANSMGLARYPSRQYLQELCNAGIPLSGHICGQWMKDLLQGKLNVFNDLAAFWPYFSRIQFNYVNYFNDPKAVEGTFNRKVNAFIDALSAECWIGKELIFPYNEYSHTFITNEVAGIMQDAQILHDASMGKGTSQDSWLPAFPKNLTGYAGGLKPEDLDECLIKIDEAVKLHSENDDTPIWIDMESGIRTNNEFDMNKAQKVLEIAAKYY